MNEFQKAKLEERIFKALSLGQRDATKLYLDIRTTFAGIPASDIIREMVSFEETFKKYNFRRKGALFEEIPLPANPTLFQLAQHIVDPNFTFSAEFEMIATRDGYREIQEVVKRTSNFLVNTFNDHDSGSRKGRTDSWNFQTDGSLRGEGSFDQTLELSTPALTGMAGLVELYTVMTEFERLERERKIKTNQSCGTHIRIGGFSENIEDAKAFCHFMYQSRKVYMSLITPNRRNNNYAKWDTNFAEKYCACSIRPFRDQKCIEIRAHQGTVNFDKIMAWILLSQATMRTVMTLQQEKKKFRFTVKNYFKKIVAHPELLKYLGKRFDEVNSDVARSSRPMDEWPLDKNGVLKTSIKNDEAELDGTDFGPEEE